ncbi:hypothetical protein H2248_004880 [Termitomyces sp. 'cryptogamus']|nr:hypothetical protein H2248_004880 [Termitomyces sp. 'cryptogamus']
MNFRSALLSICCFAFLMTLSMFYYAISIPQNMDYSCVNIVRALNGTTPQTPTRERPPETDVWETSKYVRTVPQARFQDNLRKDTFYLTSWTKAGFTNQFIGYVNMVYLGTVSDRIPIIPPFAPDDHISSSAGPLPFGEIFDLDRLRRSLRKPVLEWSDVKSLPPRLSLDAPSSVEQFGCWSTRPPHEKEPFLAHNLLHHLGLDISYTRLPEYIRQDPSLAAHSHIALMPLAQKIYSLNPLTHSGDEILMAPSPHGAKLSPNNHLACFDFMYYASVGTQPYEWQSSWSPVWRHIGRYLEFTEPIIDIVKGYVRRALQVITYELPPFITVHARRGDFVHQCWDVPSQCLAPLSAYVRKVKEIQGAIFVKFGIKVTEVLITSGLTMFVIEI